MYMGCEWVLCTYIFQKLQTAVFLLIMYMKQHHSQVVGKTVHFMNLLNTVQVSIYILAMTT